MPPGENEMERWKRDFWRVNLALDMPDLVPPAVVWAVFDEDPVPGFEGTLRKDLDYHRRKLEEAGDPEEKRIARNVFLRVGWNHQFRQVTGDRVYLLGSAPNRSDCFSSNGPDGRKWFATKVVEIRGEPACWCLPVQVSISSEVDVQFDRSNQLDLARIYDRIVGSDTPHRQ